MFSITRLNTLKKRGCYTKTFTKCFYSKSNTCSAYINYDEFGEIEIFPYWVYDKKQRDCLF